LDLAAGLFVAGGVHAVKSIAIRPAVSATTGGAGNVPISILEDMVSTLVSILSIIIPIFIGLVVIFLLSWLLWRRSSTRPY